MSKSRIEEVFNDWKAQTFLIISVISGILALLVSGYIEYYFFTGILQNLSFVSFIIAVVLETAKLCSIVIHRFVENQQTRSLVLPGRIVFLNRLARILLILFSLICSFAKISEFMESPRLESMWKIENSKITKEYNNKYSEAEKLWKSKIEVTKVSIDTLANQMNRALLKVIDDLTLTKTDLNRSAYSARDNFTIQKYKDIAYTNTELRNNRVEFIQTQYNKQLRKQDSIHQAQLKLRDSNLANIEWKRDSTLSSSYNALKNSMDVQAPLIVGIFMMTKKSGFDIDFKTFQARFVLIVALFISLLLELIIMNAFNYLTLVYLLRINKEDYDENTYFHNRSSLWERIKQAFKPK
jgi:hypothetical protein